MDRPLASALLEASSRKDAEPSAAIEHALAEIVGAARADHPGIAVDDTTFVRALGRRLDATKPVAAGLAALRASDLFLACACALGDRHAILRFEDECIRKAEGAIRKRGVSPEISEEAKQNVRERLLVGGGAPKLLDYDGRGDLRQWVRVALVREAIYLSKKQKKDEPLAYDLLVLPASEDDPEVAYFKKHYRAEYKEAFQAAMAQLSARDRALLRQQYILGLNVDEIGKIYQVHRATAARWVGAARDELLSLARAELVKRLGLSREETENIVRMIESQLEVSLRRLLVATSPAPK